jgi:hypothetical protein
MHACSFGVNETYSDDSVTMHLYKTEAFHENYKTGSTFYTTRKTGIFIGSNKFHWLQEKPMKIK